MTTKPLIGLALALALAAPAYAERDHDRGRGHEREAHYGTPHWVFDQRFHHNHYYPAPGYRVRVLPVGHRVIVYGRRRYFFDAGVWWTFAGAEYVVVRPPVGIVVPVLPPAYTTVWVRGVPYYYANDVYYVSRPDGYAVADEPPDAAIAQPPASAAPAPQAATPPPAGSWYYCESSKTYYPYVTECREGWKQVPATPPH